MRGGWCTKAISGSYRVMLWKYIQREWTQFSQFIKFAVGDGSRIKFWSDAWCGTVSLKGTFPELCHITQDSGSYASPQWICSLENKFHTSSTGPGIEVTLIVLGSFVFY